MDPAWITLIGTLSGGVLVGFFAVLTKLIDQNSQGKAVSRQKLEELHALLFEYLGDVVNSKDAVDAGPVHQVTSDVLFETIRDWVHKPLVKIVSQQRLYADEIKFEFSELIDKASNYTQSARQWAANGYKDKTDVEKTYNDLQEVLGEATDAMQDYIFAKSLIPNQGRRLRWAAKIRHRSRRRAGFHRLNADAATNLQPTQKEKDSA